MRGKNMMLIIFKIIYIVSWNSLLTYLKERKRDIFFLSFSTFFWNSERIANKHEGNTWHDYSSRGHSHPRLIPSWWLPRVAPCVQSGGHVKPVDVDHVLWLKLVASVSTWWWRHRLDSCASRRPDSPPRSHRPPASANAWWRITDNRTRETILPWDRRENKRPPPECGQMWSIPGSRNVKVQRYKFNSTRFHPNPPISRARNRFRS